MNLDFRGEAALEGARAFAAVHYSGHRCGECRFAQFFAMEDRAACVATGNGHFGQMRIAASPACRRFAVRPSIDVAMARFAAATVRSQSFDVARAS